MTKVKNASEAASGAVQKIVGPETSEDLQGCQDVPEGQDEAELEKTEFIEYAVTAANGLRLRQEPSRDAPVAAVLPCGIGVLGNARPAEGGWRQVFTGRLFGWVMDEFLEPLELGSCDDDG